MCLQKAIDHAFKLVSKRLDDLCNFVEDDTLFGDDTHLIYRHFATLYFIVICDKAESELGILDLIQVRSQPFLSFVHQKKRTRSHGSPLSLTSDHPSNHSPFPSL